MTISGLIKSLDEEQIGQEIYDLVRDLYPLCRSITGQGVRDTLSILQKHIPVEMHEVPTGTPAFDWVVPKEWNIRDAYIKDAAGRRVIDFKKSNLHVVSYSVPVNRKMSLAELRNHLYTLPDQPKWIPYRTSYYKEDWGFCLSHAQFEQLREAKYEVCIDASLTNGHLTYGEYVLDGEQPDEVLITCHICHPSLANDNLSGIAVAAFLVKCLGQVARRYSYRFLFIPGTIGSITWLCLNEHRVERIRHGLVLACVGDSGPFTYKKSRRGNAEIDQAAAHVLKHAGEPYSVVDFFPFGYDERQFCSPGFNLPVGCFMRTPHGQFPEYHTSADDLNFINAKALASSFATVLLVLQVLEENRTYLNTNPRCEPQLGKRGLYRSVSGQADRSRQELDLLWVLNLSDGQHSLLEIAQRANVPFGSIVRAAKALLTQGLLKEHAV